ncbi:hypothetical protein KAU45_10170 [bacterium]|nr:hypothetical protein [bacterium]
MKRIILLLTVALVVFPIVVRAEYYYSFDGTGGWTWEDPSYIWEAPPLAHYEIDANYRRAYDSYTDTTQVGDSIDIRVTYDAHSDGNSRQLIIVGFVDSLAETHFDFVDAIFVYMGNYWGTPVAIPYAWKDGGSINLTGSYPPPDWQQGYGEYRYWIKILSTSQYRTRCWKDGTLVWDSTNSGDITGLDTNYAAIFNTRTSSYPLEGYHHGTVDYLYWGEPDPSVEETTWGQIKALK